MLHLIYIGRHADTIEQFSKIAEGHFMPFKTVEKQANLSIKYVRNMT